jgi:hypothetical protein
MTPLLLFVAAVLIFALVFVIRDTIARYVVDEQIATIKRAVQERATPSEGGSVSGDDNVYGDIPPVTQLPTTLGGIPVITILPEIVTPVVSEDPSKFSGDAPITISPEFSPSFAPEFFSGNATKNSTIFTPVEDNIRECDCVDGNAEGCYNDCPRVATPDSVHVDVFEPAATLGWIDVDFTAEVDVDTSIWEDVDTSESEAAVDWVTTDYGLAGIAANTDTSTWVDLEDDVHNHNHSSDYSPESENVRTGDSYYNSSSESDTSYSSNDSSSSSELLQV